MGKRNGYFQLVIREHGTFLRLIPPVENGERIDISEVISYLSKIKIGAIDAKEINAAIIKLTNQPIDILLTSDKMIPKSESVQIAISEDKMTATVRFYPPSTDGEMLDKKGMLSDLSLAGIKAGVDENVMDKLLESHEYCKNYVLARGIEPVQGKDASITYHFNTELSLKPTVNEDGSVDFHNLNNMARINEGEVLATLTKEELGHPGINVCGEVIKPREVKKAKLKHGHNITLTEDGLQLISQVNGHASLVEDKVFVSNIYEVEDVDASTGDINYEGNVLVKGNVRSGYSITAKGNIEVNGVIEGSYLRAEGDILLKRGIQGMGKADVECEGNLVAKFIENAKVVAGGFIQTESIMHSHVAAKGEIEVNGKKGFVTGGVIRSAKYIEAKNIGSPMGTDTVLEVGVDPVMKEHYQELHTEIKEANKILSASRPVLNAYGKKMGLGEKFTKEQMEKLQELQKTVTENEQKVAQSLKEIEEIEGLLNTETSACIKARGFVYPGVKIVISDAMLYIRENLTYCRFVREKGEIKGYTL